MSANFYFLLIFLVFVFLPLFCNDTNQKSILYNNSVLITIAVVFHNETSYIFQSAMPHRFEMKKIAI